MPRAAAFFAFEDVAPGDDTSSVVFDDTLDAGIPPAFSIASFTSVRVIPSTFPVTTTT